MANIIEGIILIAMIAIGVKESVKHFRGESSCCGSLSEKTPKKKLDHKVIKTVTFHVYGMHYKNCANTVARAVNTIEGASAKVNLNKKTAFVSFDRDVDEELIRNVIRKAGYTVVDHPASEPFYG